MTSTSDGEATTVLTALVSVLVLGFVLGMRHATDPDHVVAVTTIVSQQRSLARAGAHRCALGDRPHGDDPPRRRSDRAAQGPAIGHSGASRALARAGGGGDADRARPARRWREMTAE